MGGINRSLRSEPAYREREGAAADAIRDVSHTLQQQVLLMGAALDGAQLRRAEHELDVLQGACFCVFFTWCTVMC